MPLFGKSKEEKASEAMEALRTLSARVAETATVLVRSLVQSEGLGISDSSIKWRVHTEVLGLLCHLVNRWSLAMGGPAFRAGLVDRVVPYVINGVVDSAWDGSRAGQHVDVEEWQGRMKEELLHNVNVAGLEYGDCKVIIGPPEHSGSWGFRDDNVVGRFAGNITRLTYCDPVERITVVYAVIGLLADSKMREDIEDVWRNTR